MRALLAPLLLLAGLVALQACGEEAPTLALGDEVLWLTDPREEVALEATAAVDDAGRLWVAWLSWTEDAREPALLLGLVEGERLVRRTRVEDAGLGLARPVLAPAPDGMLCAWETRLNARSVVCCVDARAEGDALVLSTVRRLSEEARNAHLPALARVGARVVCAWQSAEPGGLHDIRWRALEDGAWGDARVLSGLGGEHDAWHPRLASSPGDVLHAVWDQDAKRIAHAELDLDEPDSLVRRTAVVEAEYASFPQVALDEAGRAWVAWEQATQLGVAGGLRAERELGLARLTDETLQRALLAPAPERGRSELPQLAVVAGVPSLAARTLGPVHYRNNPRRAPAYSTYLAAIESFDERGAALRTQLDRSEGGNGTRQTLLALPDGGLALLFGSDARTRVYPQVNSFDGPIEGRWRLGLKRVGGSAAEPRFAPSEERRPLGPSFPHPRWGGELLWGDLHRHTSRSRCAGDEDGLFVDAVRWARREQVDFFAITDHFQHLQPWSWWSNRRDVERWNDPPRLLVLHGLERVLAGEGHQNLIFAEEAAAALDAPNGVDAEQLVAIPHMLSLGDNPFPAARWNGELQRLVEVYQANRGSYEGADLPLESNGVRAPGADIASAHALGKAPGMIAASDHSQTGDGWAGVFVSERTRAALFAALRGRRTFASTAKRRVELRLGELAQGQRGAVSARDELVVVSGGAHPASLVRVDVIKNGQAWRSLEFGAGAETFALSTRYRQTARGGPLRVRAIDGRFVDARLRRPERGDAERTEFEDDELRLWRAGTTATLLFGLEPEPGATPALEVSFANTRQRVELDELQRGRSMRLRSIQGRLEHLWRLGAAGEPDAGGEHRFADEERRAGDVYYARLSWSDGELAWTSPIVVSEVR